MAARQISNGSADGTSIGQSASDLVGFHGASPVAQGAYVASISTSWITTSLGFGFVTSDNASAALTLINAMRTILVNKGFMASS